MDGKAVFGMSLAIFWFVGMGFACGAAFGYGCATNGSDHGQLFLKGE
jgi:hypothetical protein